MNFGDRFKSHAKTLAEAAKQFQSFDEMAEQDDYIHSDGLNVSNTNITMNNNDSTPSRGPPTRTTSELLDSLISPITLQQQTVDEPHRRPSSNDSNSSHAEHRHESSDSLDYREEDPMLDTLNSKRTLKKKSSDLMPTSNERKAANRFMDDLEELMAKPNVEQGQSQTTTNESSSITNNSDNWGWVKGAATSKMNELMGRPSFDREETLPFRSPLSRTASSVRATESTTPEEEFHIVQSSAILGEEDQAELDRIRLGAQGDSLTFVLNIVKQHPQFAFIGFTLVLGSAMYFYSRYRGAEDDVN